VSDLKVDGVIASTGTNTNLTLQGRGSGKVAIGDGALLFPDADGSDGEFIKTDGSGALSFAEAGGGKIVQVVTDRTTTPQTGTTTFPHDNTIPQKTEGNEFQTITITPTSNSNKLIIDVHAFVGHSVTDATVVIALFKDADADALQVSAAVSIGGGGDYGGTGSFRHIVTSPGTSAITYKIRAGGPQAGTTYYNGNGAIGGAIYGTADSSVITIWEVEP